MTEHMSRRVNMADLSPLMVEILQRGGSVELTVTGSSMWPMLRHRVSRVKLTPAGRLEKGDLPLYRRDNGAYVLHRVIGEENGSYTCCGDNQWVSEPGIRPDQVLAVVTEFARGKRWVSCRNWWYRLYRQVWVAIRPLRRLVFGGLRRIGRLAGGVLQKLRGAR